MNKFLKGAVACAALVPCMMGLTACGKKEETKPNEAYGAVVGELNNIVTKMGDITKPNTEFQLNVNVSISLNEVIDGTTTTDFDTKIRAVVGARNGDNRELLGNIGIVSGEGQNEEFTSLLSVYGVDQIGANGAENDEAYVPAGVLTPEKYQLNKDILYVLVGEDYVLASGDFDDSLTYYVKSTDFMHFYLESNIDILKEFTLTTEIPTDWEDSFDSYYTKVGEEYHKITEQNPTYEANVYYEYDGLGGYNLLTEVEAPADWETSQWYYRKDGQNYVNIRIPVWAEDTVYEQTGLDINELLNEMDLGFEIPTGKMYATLNIGDELIETPDESNPEFSLDQILDIDELVPSDYNEFIKSLGAGVSTVAKKDKNGDMTLTISFDGTTMNLIARANGGITISVSTGISEPEYGYSQSMSVVIDIDLTEDFDEQYIPTNLDDYGNDPVNLEEILAGLLGE